MYESYSCWWLNVAHQKSRAKRLLDGRASVHMCARLHRNRCVPWCIQLNNNTFMQSAQQQSSTPLPSKLLFRSLTLSLSLPINKRTNFMIFMSSTIPFRRSLPDHLPKIRTQTHTRRQTNKLSSASIYALWWSKLCAQQICQFSYAHHRIFVCSQKRYQMRKDIVRRRRNGMKWSETKRTENNDNNRN